MTLHLILGDDPVLIGEAVTAAIDELIGDGDRGLMLEVLGEGEYKNDDGGYDSLCLIDAVRTPPFLTDKRVVVGRQASRFSRKDDYGPLFRCSPSHSTPPTSSSCGKKVLTRRSKRCRRYQRR